MADGRMLRKKASRDRQLAQLTEPAALLYLLSIPHLDREGRMIGLPAWVRGTIVPAFVEQRPDDWTDELVSSRMLEWTQTRDSDGQPWPLVLWYATEGESVCLFVGFASNQNLERSKEPRSTLPPPPPELLAQHGLVLDGRRLLRAAKVRNQQVSHIRGHEQEVEVEVQAGRELQDPARAREPDAEGLPVAHMIGASLAAAASSQRPPASEPSLPDELGLIAARVRPDPDGHEVNPKTLAKLRGQGLPPAAFARAYEALEARRHRQPPLRSEPRYFVAALNQMLREGQYGPAREEAA